MRSFLLLIKILKLKIIVILICLTLSFTLNAQTTFSGTGNWSNIANWSSGVPDALTDAIIDDGAICTIDVAAVCNNLSFVAGNSADASVTIGGANSLSVSGNVNFTAPGNPRSQTLDIANGTLTCTDLVMVNTGANTRKTHLLISNGTVNINGSVILGGNNLQNYITFTGSGALNVSGNLGIANTGRITADAGIISIGGDFNVNVFTANTSTVIFNSASSQRVNNGSYYNIILLGGGNKYLVANTTILVGGTITFNSGNLDLSGFDLTINSTTNFAGIPSGTSMIDFQNGGRLYKAGTAVAHWINTYPIGTGTDYSPLDITGIAGDVNGNLYISLTGLRHPMLNGSDNAITRYWDLSSTNLVGTTYTGSFTYTDNDIIAPIIEANLTKTGRLSSGGWIENQAGTSYDHATNQITFNATSILDTWTLGENLGCFDAALPTKYTVNHGNWNTPSTWNGGTVPVVGDEVWILHTVTNNVAGISPSKLSIRKTGYLNLNNYAITVTGSTDIYGTLIDGNNIGVNTFQGKVTIYPAGRWTSTTTTTAGNMIFQGGILNDGSFAAGTADFTANQTIEGISAMTFSNNVRIGAGNVLTNQNTGGVSITGTLDGIGAGAEWVNDVNSTLEYLNATKPFNVNGTLTASANPNIVKYSRNGAQTISTSGAYYDLIIEGGNIKTVVGLLTINNDLIFQNIISNATITTTTNNVTIGRDLIAGNNGFIAIITQTSGTLSVARNLNVNGGNALYLNSNATVSNNINVSNNSTISINGNGGVAYAIFVLGNINIDLGSAILSGTTNFTNTLTLDGNLTINGDFDLWFDVNSRTSLIINSNVPHSFNGVPFSPVQLFDLTLNAASNTTSVDFALDIEGSVDIGLGATLDAGVFDHTVYTNWTNAGTLSSTGTIIFDGVTQTISAEPNFNNVTFEGSNIKTVAGTLTTVGNFKVNGGVTINTTNNNLIIGADLVASNSVIATLTQTTGTLTAINLNVNGGNTFNLNSQATFSQDINVLNNSTLSINSAGGVIVNISTRDINIELGSTLDNANTTFDNNLTINRDLIVNGTFDLWFDANSRTNLIINSNVAHNFTGVPTLIQLYNFIINATSNTTTTAFALDIEGSVNIGTGSIFDAGGLFHNVYTDWIDTGTLIGAGSTFTFDGGIQNIDIEPNFNNVEFTTIGNKYLIGDIVVNGTLGVTNATIWLGNNTTARTHQFLGDVTITSGGIYTNAANVVHSITLGGNLTINNIFDLYSNAIQYTTLSFTGNTPHVISGTPITVDLFNIDLLVNSNTTTLGFDILTSSTDYIRNDINVESGATFNMNGYDVDTYGNILIANGGTFTINDNSVLKFYAAAKYIDNSGTLNIDGTIGNVASITASAVGNRFYINSNAGSTLVCDNYSIDYLTGNGIFVSAGATVDIPSTNFSDGTFGTNCNSTQCVDLTGVDFLTNSPITASNIIFDNSGTFNFTRTTGTGSINFVDASGVKAGENYDNDDSNPGTKINWINPGLTFYSRATGVFSNTANWGKAPAGAGASPVAGDFTSGLATFIIQDNHDITIDLDLDVLEIQVGQGTNGNLIVGNDVTGRNINIRSKLSVSTTAGLNAATAGIPVHSLNLYGNLYNSGNIILKNSGKNVNTNFYNTTGQIYGTSIPVFNDITFKAASNTTANVDLDINGNVVFEVGAIFQDGGATVNVEGNWTQSSLLQMTPASGTIVFDGTTNTIGTTATFNNVTFQGSGAANINAAIIVDGNFTVTNNTWLTPNVNVTVAKDFSIINSSTYNQSVGGSTNFVGTGAQLITITGSATFYDLTFSNGDPQPKTINGDLNVLRYFTLNAGATIDDAVNNHSFSNTTTINGTCNLSGTITQKGGNITSTNLTLNLPNLIDLIIETGTIYVTPSAATLDVIVGGNVSQNSGQLVINPNATLSGDGDGVFSVNGAYNLYLRGTDNFPSNFLTYNISSLSITRYDEDADQIIRGCSGWSYGTIYVYNRTNANAHIKTADGNLLIAGDLNFITSTTSTKLKCDHDITIDGNISNAFAAGTVATIEQVGAYTLTMGANANQTISSGRYDINNIHLSADVTSSAYTKTIVAPSILNLLGNFEAICTGGSSSQLMQINMQTNGVGGSPIDFNLGEYCQLNSSALTFGLDFFDKFTGNILFDVNSYMLYSAASPSVADKNCALCIGGVFAYGNLQFSTTGDKTAEGPIDINGDISVFANTPVFVAGNYTHTIAKDWLLGTANATQASMVTSTVVFDGVNQKINATNFNNIEIASTDESYLNGNISVYGNLTINPSATLNAGTTTAFNIDIHGNWISPSGTFIHTNTTGRVTFCSTLQDQTITSNPLNVFGNMYITKNNGLGNQTVTALTDFTVLNTLFLTRDQSILDISNKTLTLSGYFTYYDNINIVTPSFITTNSNVVFNGISSQRIFQGSQLPLTFNNVQFSGANKIFDYYNAPPIAARLVNITGNVQIDGCTVDGDGWTNGGVDFSVQGDWIVNGGGFVHSNVNRKVTFDGANQTIDGAGFGNFGSVVIAGTNTKLLNGNLELIGNLTVDLGSTLDVNVAQNNSITLAGIWTNNGSFLAQNGLVKFNGTNGTNPNIITGGIAATQKFWDIEVSQTAGARYLGGDIDIDNDLTITQGTFDNRTYNVFIGGNFQNSGTFTHLNNGTLIKFDALGGTKTLNPGLTGITFNGITFDAPGATYIVENNFSVNNNHDFTINNGYVDMNGKTLTVNSGNQKIIINGGTFDLNAGQIIFTGNDQYILNQGGILKFVGNTGANCLVTKTGGRYWIEQTSGTFHAKYYNFDQAGYLLRSAVTISGGTIDVTNNFSVGSFTGGASNAGVSYLNLDNCEIDNTINIIASNVTFSSGVNTNKNCKRVTLPVAPNDGYIEFQDASGNITGASNEIDDGAALTGNVRWSNPNGYYWTRGSGTNDDWNDPTNWLGGVVPDTSANVYLNHDFYNPGGGYSVRITSANAETYRLTLDAQGGLPITLLLENGYDLKVYEKVTIGTNTTLTQIDNASTIFVKKDWDNSGTYTPNNATIIFNGDPGIYTIKTGGIGAGKKFYNFEINSPGAAEYEVRATMDVDNNFTITKGILDLYASTSDLIVGGDWFVNPSTGGDFIHANADVTFDRNDGFAQNITGTPQFFNFITAGVGTKIINSDIDILGGVTIGTGTILDALTYSIYVGRNWTVDGTGSFSQTTPGPGIVIFNGTVGTQLIDNGTSVIGTDFNNVELRNISPKTFNKDCTFQGNLTISNGTGTVNLQTFVLLGNSSNNFSLGQTTMQIRGTNNFPANFGTYTIASNSTVEYMADINQTIMMTDGTWSYGNLTLTDNTSPVASIKTCPVGNLDIKGNIRINRRITLDMNTNSSNMILAGNLDINNAGVVTDALGFIDWGTGTSKLTHVGGDWNIDADITGFNNLELQSSGIACNKWMYSDWTITGDLSIKDKVNLRMYTNNNYANYHVINCTGLGKTFSIEATTANGAGLFCSTPGIVDVAMPTGFANYQLSPDTRVYLYSDSDQKVYTGNGINYANLTFDDANITIRNTISSDGIAELDVDGIFNMNDCFYDDGGKNIEFGGSDFYCTYYTPTSSAVVVKFDGVVDQYIRNNQFNGLTLPTVQVSGLSTKTLGDGDATTISGDLSISNDATLWMRYSSLTFSGTNWINLGKFNGESQTVTFDKAGPQIIDAGPTDVFTFLNYFNNVIFTNTGNKTFVNNGIEVRRAFDISSACTVDMGALSHYIGGTVTNTLGGTWVTTLADLTFGNTGANIKSHDLVANNILIQGNKRMFSNWTINGNFEINPGFTFYNFDNVALLHRDIICRGNWTNNGIFETRNTTTWASRGGIVTFDATSDVNIYNEGIIAPTSLFYDVVFGDAAGGSVNYNLTANNTRILRTGIINTDAIVNLNAQTLILGNAGYSTLEKTYNVLGILNVDAGAFLKFDNTTNPCEMNVSGTLKIVGNASAEASVSMYNTRGQQINITTGTIEAKYYSISDLSNAGIDVQPTATLHSINNFSEGTWANIQNTLNACYLNLETDNYLGGTIDNILFNATFTPGAGRYNVKRIAATTPAFIEFGGNIRGPISGYQYELDDLAASATVGKLHWPPVTMTNWTGAAGDEDWNTAGNWDMGVPTPLLDAIIPTGRPNYPKIQSADATCRNLMINAGSVGLVNGFDLISSGDISIGSAATFGTLQVLDPTSEIICGGVWSRHATNGLFQHGGGKVTFNSSSSPTNISPASSPFYDVVFDNSNTTFNMSFTSANTITVENNLRIENGILKPVTNGYILNVKGDFYVSSVPPAIVAQFLPNSGVTGTVNINGDFDQLITNGEFYNLTISGNGGIKSTVNNTKIINNTVIDSYFAATFGGQIDFQGNVTINSTGTFDDGGDTHTFSGATWTGTGAYTGGGKIVFSRNSWGQTINGGRFYNLEINSPYTNNYTLTLGQNPVLLNGDVVIDNNFAFITGGTYARYLNLVSYQMSNPTSVGEFKLESNVTMYVAGASNFPQIFGSYFLDPASTVDYRYSSNQNIYSTEYGNLTFNEESIKTLEGPIVVYGNLTLNNSTLDVSLSFHNIDVYKNWLNQNVLGKFVCREGTVRFMGSTATRIRVVSDLNNDFNNVYIQKDPGIAVSTDDNYAYTIKGDLEVASGIFNPTAWNRTIYIGGDLNASGGTFTNDYGAYILNKVSGAAIIRTQNSRLSSMQINSTGGAIFTTQDDLRIVRDMTITSGTFDGNGKIVAVGTNNNRLNIFGTYKIGIGGTLAIGSNWDASKVEVKPGGTIEIIGSAFNMAKVTKYSAVGNVPYVFNVEGNISAKYYLFEYMDGATGINIMNTATIDPFSLGNNFSYGTFTNNTTNNGTYLTIGNNQDFMSPNYIVDVSFPYRPPGAPANVKKTNATGTIEFNNAQGIFAGEINDGDLFEGNPSDRCIWTGPITLVWNGSISNDWNVASNWTATNGPPTWTVIGAPFVPTENENVYIANVVTHPVLTISGQKTKNLTINAGGWLEFNTDANGGTCDLEANGDVSILGKITMNTSDDYMNVKGGWSYAGTSASHSGTVSFIGDGGLKTIVNNGVGAAFYNLVISGTTTYQLHATTGNADCYVNNDITIESGAILDMRQAANKITVAGNWINNSGSFIHQNSTVVFKATTSPKIIQAVGVTAPFYHVTFNSPGVAYDLVGSEMTIDGNLSLIGTLNLNGQILSAGNGLGTVVNIQNGGLLYVGAGEYFKLGDKSIVNVYKGGALKLRGASGSPAYVTHRSTGYYKIKINPNLDAVGGGILYAQYYDISFAGDVSSAESGVTLFPGTNLDVTDNFSNGKFSNGVGNQAFLDLQCDFGLDPIIKNVIFEGNYPNPIYNVIRTVGINVVTFQDASGTLGAFDYENDAIMPADATTGLILWTDNNTCRWTGALDSDWHNAGNWTCGVVPDITKFVIIPNTATKPIISTASAEARKITIQSFNGISLNINNQNLTIAEELAYGGSIVVSGTPTITIGDKIRYTPPTPLTYIPSFTPGSSTVVLNSTSITPIDILMGTYNATGPKNCFYNLELSGGALTSFNVNMQTAASPLMITNNLVINSGNLVSNNYSIYVGGDWNNLGGAFTYSTNKYVYLYAPSGSHIVKTNGYPFYHLEVNSNLGTGTASLLTNSNIEIDGNYYLKKGTFDMSPDGGTTSYNMIVKGGVFITGGSFLARASQIEVRERWSASVSSCFTKGTSTVTLKGTGATRTIYIFDITCSFHNLIINSAPNTYTLTRTAYVGNDLTISSGTLDLTTTAGRHIKVSGNWINNGAFNSRTNLVYFTGNTTISGTSTNTFYYVWLSGTLTSTSGNVNIQNTFVNAGTFNHNNGTISFTGISLPQTLRASVNTTFYNLNVNSAQSLTIGDPSVSNKIVRVTNNFTWFDNNNTVIVGNNRPVTFELDGDITIPSGCTLTPVTSFGTVKIGGNWNNSGVLTTSGTVVFDGVTNQNINNTETFYNLTIDNTAPADHFVILTGNVSVTNQLNLTNGIFSTGVNSILIGNGASSTIGSSSSFVMGKIKKIGNTVASAYTFPTGDTINDGLGNITNYWAPISVAAFDNTNDFTAQYYHKSTTAVLGIDNLSSIGSLAWASGLEFWNLDRTGAGAQVPAVTLFWKNADASGISNDGSNYTAGVLADLTIAHWNAGLTSWDDMGGNASGIFPEGEITSTVAFTGYSPITFASKAKKNPLPIELLSFDAEPNGKIVNLIWTTTSELNNNYFTIERSKDAVNFEKVINVNGAGNSNRTLNYSAKDINPYDGISYYRLKQTDFDGKFTYSGIVSVEFLYRKKLDLSVFPNPAKNGESIYLKFEGIEKAKEILVVVRDVMGKEWYSKVHITSETENSVFAIDSYNNIAPGVYIVTGTSNDGIYYKRIVIE